jgi:hypothetical protein
VTVHIKSDVAGASAPGGLRWDNAGDVVEVEDHQVARELLAIPGFTEHVPDGAQPVIGTGIGQWPGDGYPDPARPGAVVNGPPQEQPAPTAVTVDPRPSTPANETPETVGRHGKHEDNDGDGQADREGEQPPPSEQPGDDPAGDDAGQDKTAGSKPAAAKGGRPAASKS